MKHKNPAPTRARQVRDAKDPWYWRNKLDRAGTIFLIALAVVVTGAIAFMFLLIVVQAFRLNA